jgi:hypothetical protein
VNCFVVGLGSKATSYWRAFTPSTFGVVGQFSVTGVRIGIQEVRGGTEPLTINIYATTSGSFPTGTRTLIGTTNTTVLVGTAFFQDIAVTAPPQLPSTEIVVEVASPDLSAADEAFFIGSNGAGQSAPSYVSAPDCSLATPTDVGTAGFPNMHELIALVGVSPTAAEVSVSGRVLTSASTGVRGARVTLQDSRGNTLTSLTNAFGYYTFASVLSGDTYIANASSRGFIFAPRVITVHDAVTDIDFSPQ